MVISVSLGSGTLAAPDHFPLLNRAAKLPPKGGLHAWNDSDRTSDPGADRRPAELGLQPLMGLLPLRRPGPGGGGPPGAGADRANLTLPVPLSVQSQRALPGAGQARGDNGVGLAEIGFDVVVVQGVLTDQPHPFGALQIGPVSYTHLRAHETGRNLVCRLLLE